MKQKSISISELDKAVTLDQAVQEYLTAKTPNVSRNKGAILQYVLRRKLRPIADTPLVQVTPGQVWRLLLDHRLSLRKRMLYMSVTWAFFSWARAQGYLPQLRVTAADLIQLPAPPPTHPRILKTAELKALLSTMDVESRLAIALGCFAGLRWQELERLRWENVQFGQIRLYKPIAIGRGRVVVVVPVLDSWLRPFHGGTDHIFASMVALRRRVARAAGKIGIQWSRNILRHTFAAHLIALTDDSDAAACQLGCSQPLIRYCFQPLSKHAAKEFFSLTPERVGIQNWDQVVANYIAKSAARKKARGGR